MYCAEKMYSQIVELNSTSFLSFFLFFFFRFFLKKKSQKLVLFYRYFLFYQIAHIFISKFCSSVYRRKNEIVSIRIHYTYLKYTNELKLMTAAQEKDSKTKRKDKRKKHIISWWTSPSKRRNLIILELCNRIWHVYTPTKTV